MKTHNHEEGVRIQDNVNNSVKNDLTWYYLWITDLKEF